MRKKKNFIVYYRKEKFPPDPFSDFEDKRDVYYGLFNTGYEKGYNMFISSSSEENAGLTFAKNLLFDGEKFVKFENKVIADAIFDRSGGLSFPSSEINGKVLNDIDFKKLCADKFATSNCLGELMSKTYLVKNKKDLEKNIKNFSEDELVVLKPSNGMQGKGVIVDKAHEVAKADLEENKEYILQKFVDTSKGIEGIVDGLHDLRVVIVEGEIVWCHVRQPKKGTYLANVALGGSIREVEIDKIPEYVLEAVHKIQNIIDKKFNKPIYSIDFGISNKIPYVFELNDQIGFPRVSMKNKDLFTSNIIRSLERLSS